MKKPSQDLFLYQEKIGEFLEEARSKLKITKAKLPLNEAIRRTNYSELTRHLVEAYKPYIDIYNFLNKNPLLENQFYNYSVHYQNTGKKLPEKYFNYDLDKLNIEYEKIDTERKKAKKENRNMVKRYNESRYVKYVEFMTLKMYGVYSSEQDDYFNIKPIEEGRRHYTPLTSVPTVLRPELPFELIEFDITRAFPTFIDLELGIKRTDEEYDAIYDVLDKRTFNMLLNIHKDSPKADINNVRKQLEPIYKDRINDVVTDERFNKKGAFAKHFEQIETKYINKFIEANLKPNGIPYARLHDGLFIMADVETKDFITEFDSVRFKIKTNIRPEKLRNTQSFYTLKNGKIEADAYSYLRFLENENIAKLESNDEKDKVRYFKNDNRIIKILNEDIFGSILRNNIIHYKNKDVINKIAKDIGSSTFTGALKQLKSVEDKYYKDTKDTSCIMFKNGLFQQSFDEDGKIKVEKISVDNVKGNWFEHIDLNKVDFEYTEELSDFEVFLHMAVLNREMSKDENGKYVLSDLTEEEKKIMLCWFTMIGYGSTSYKPVNKNWMVIFTDEFPDPFGENRNGRRGKSLIQKALETVHHKMSIPTVSWSPNERFAWNGLKSYQKLLILDDLPLNFPYGDLFSDLTGGIKGEIKNGGMINISPENSPKFFGSTNFAIGDLQKDSSSKDRFAEFKLTDFFKASEGNRPVDYFGKLFFTNEWTNDDWCKFYSWMFRCIGHYQKNSLLIPEYDRQHDDFISCFSNDAKLAEFERLIDIVLRNTNNFKSQDILDLYNHRENFVCSREKWFTHNNLKKCIKAYFDMNGVEFSINSRRIYTVVNYKEVKAKRIEDEKQAEIKVTEERRLEYIKDNKDNTEQVLDIEVTYELIEPEEIDIFDAVYKDDDIELPF